MGLRSRKRDEGSELGADGLASLLKQDRDSTESSLGGPAKLLDMDGDVTVDMLVQQPVERLLRAQETLDRSLCAPYWFRPALIRRAILSPALDELPE